MGWDETKWDRHELLLNGMGWDRKICPMDKPVRHSTKSYLETAQRQSSIVLENQNSVFNENKIFKLEFTLAI